MAAGHTTVAKKALKAQLFINNRMNDHLKHLGDKPRSHTRDQKRICNQIIQPVHSRPPFPGYVQHLRYKTEIFQPFGVILAHDCSFRNMVIFSSNSLDRRQLPRDYPILTLQDQLCIAVSFVQCQECLAELIRRQIDLTTFPRSQTFDDLGVPILPQLRADCPIHIIFRYIGIPLLAQQNRHLRRRKSFNAYIQMG